MFLRLCSTLSTEWLCATRGLNGWQVSILESELDAGQNRVFSQVHQHRTSALIKAIFCCRIKAAFLNASTNEVVALPSPCKHLQEVDSQRKATILRIYWFQGNLRAYWGEHWGASQIGPGLQNIFSSSFSVSRSFPLPHLQIKGRYKWSARETNSNLVNIKPYRCFKRLVWLLAVLLVVLKKKREGRGKRGNLSFSPVTPGFLKTFSLVFTKRK